MIDPVTLVFALGLSEATTSASLLIMLRKKQERALLYWIISKGVIAVGLVSLFLRDWFLPADISIIITNVCLISGYAVLWAAGRIFMRRKVHFLWHAMPAVIGISIVLYYLYGVESAGHRATFSSLFYMSFSTLYASEFLRKNKIEPHTFTQRYIGILMLLNSVFFLYFSYLVRLDSMRPDFFDQPAYALQFIWIFSFFIGIAHAIAAVSAVFERQHLKLTELYDKEQSLLEDKQNTLFTLSHEFRNPVTAIDRSVQLLQMAQDRSAPEFEERLAGIRKRANYLHEMLDQFTLSDLGELAGTDSEKRLVSLRDIREQLVLAIHSEEQQRRLKFQGDCDTPVAVFCYPGELGIALRNLAHNALKYSPGDKPIVLSVHTVGDRQIFRVEDFGIGIDRDEIHQVERQFFRSRKVRDFEGTGLGLSVVKWVADLHGGTLSIKSTPGEGTVIELAIPTS